MHAQPHSTPTTDFETRVGHPPRLFVLFFAEMWERFSYYGMRALLVLYMTRHLHFDRPHALAIYAMYTGLVYLTPLAGGALADAILGRRKAVLIGGLLMALGHLAMASEALLFYALGLLIVGNGFFKPNISTIVGGLYPAGDSRRDGGFTLFYMGINLGAALAPLLCGYIGETYGWHYGFGLATIGMLIGLAVFVAPARLTQILIGLGAVGAASAMLWTGREDTLMLAVNAPVAVALLVAAGIAWWALQSGALPTSAGAPPDPERLRARVGGFLTAESAVYVGALVAVPLLALLVQRDALASLTLSAFGVLALGSIFVEALRAEKVARERLFVVLVMMFFSMLFWAFFEQAGSSISNFTDRNVDRVVESRALTQADIGKAVDVELSQELVGHAKDGKVFTLDQLDAARKDAKTVSWTVAPADVGMGVDGSEIPASTFQAANPIFILLFGLVFSAMWGWLGRLKLEPSTPVKFAMGLAQLGLGFGVLWYGAQNADARGMVGMSWLVLAYLLHTTGELCLSPVGLSMVTRLSPKHMIATVMGGWFLATAFSNLLGGIIAQLTGVSHGEEGAGAVPPPVDTVHVYGDVFGQIAVACGVATLVLLALSPALRKWMHEEVAEDTGEPAPSRGH